MEKYNFQYCQKLVILSKDKSKVLLCKRKGEADYDGVFSFAGGKMEITDQTIISGLKREKDEELGADFKILLYPKFSQNILFRKKDKNAMILPHYLAIHQQGEISLSKEYSTYSWVSIDELPGFEPKIPNIAETVKQLLILEKIAKQKDFILI